MKTKHTSGPWFAVEYAGRFEIQDGPYYSDKNILDQDKYTKAGANAKLAVAAPDMLTVLEMANDMLTLCGSIEGNGALHEAILIAIKKATL